MKAIFAVVIDLRSRSSKMFKTIHDQNRKILKNNAFPQSPGVRVFSIHLIYEKIPFVKIPVSILTEFHAILLRT